MKRYLNLVFLLLVLALLGSCSEAGHEHAAGSTRYTCPMHPEIVRDAPGTCPICHMDLVAQVKPAHDAGMAIGQDLDFLLRPTNSTVVATIATTKPRQQSVPVTVSLAGVISYDPRQVYSVAARTGGRIEKLFVQYNFQPVRKGQKLLEIYSPELITAQQELLYLVQASPEDRQLQEAAKQKLRLLGATNGQISRLLRTGQAPATFAVYSPYDGYVTGLNTTTPAATPPAIGTAPAATGGGMADMGGGGGGSPTPAASAAPMPAATTIELREGMYVSTGQPLLRVVNPKQLWAEFKAPAPTAEKLTKGTPVQVSFPQLPGQTLRARVDFQQPFYEQGERFATIRVYLPGRQPGVMAGQLVSAQATLPADTGLWVPQEAVLHLGTQSVAFRQVDGVFEPVAVTPGARAAGQIQLLGGLPPEAIIAVNAQFLVDSESFVKVKE